MTTLEEKIDYHFKDQALLSQALVHKSFFNENQDSASGHNEKLEFLGDAVLDLSLSHRLMDLFPELDEGHLSKIRASLVNEHALAQIAQVLALQEAIRLGRGELNSGGKNKPRLLASVFEALVGSFYLDAGFDRVNQFIISIFDPLIIKIDPLTDFHEDYKTKLQEKTQEMFKTVPTYEVINSEGPDHKKTFVIEVQVEGKALATGEGKSKKQAEQLAAKIALEKLQ